MKSEPFPGLPEILENADPAFGLGLTRKQAARRLNLSVETLREWEKMGFGPRVIRLSPRKAYYPEYELGIFIDSCAKAGV